MPLFSTDFNDHYNSNISYFTIVLVLRTYRVDGKHQ